MGRFAVNFVELDGAVTALGAFLGFVEDNLEAIETRIAVLQRDWEGAAATQYATAQHEWHAGAVEMAEGLAAMMAAAAAAHSSYTEAADANLRLLGRGVGG